MSRNRVEESRRLGKVPSQSSLCNLLKYAPVRVHTVLVYYYYYTTTMSIYIKYHAPVGIPGKWGSKQSSAENGYLPPFLHRKLHTNIATPGTVNRPNDGSKLGPGWEGNKHIVTDLVPL